MKGVKLSYLLKLHFPSNFPRWGRKEGSLYALHFSNVLSPGVHVNSCQFPKSGMEEKQNLFNTRKRIYSIEGGIGTGNDIFNSYHLFHYSLSLSLGKTTLMTHLEEMGEGKISCFYEPITTWTNYSDKGLNLLELSYKTKRDHPSYTDRNLSLQLVVLLTFLKRYFEIEKLLKTDPNRIIVIERSFLSTLDIFLQASKQFNSMTLTHQYILADFANLLTNVYESKLVPIGLVCSYETGYNRCIKRKRPEEEKLDPYYYKVILHLTDKMISAKCEHKIETDNKSSKECAKEVYNLIIKAAAHS